MFLPHGILTTTSEPVWPWLDFDLCFLLSSRSVRLPLALGSAESEGNKHIAAQYLSDHIIMYTSITWTPTPAFRGAPLLLPLLQLAAKGPYYEAIYRNCTLSITAQSGP